MQSLNLLPGFTWIDYAILIIIGFSTAVSLMRGFVREALSLVSWAVAFWVAFNFSDQLSTTVLSKYITTPSIRHFASFGILFFLTLITGSLFNFLLASIVSGTGLSGTDRMLGMIFGFVRGVLLVGVLLLLISLTSFQQDNWWRNSALIGHFQPLTMWLKSFVPGKVQELSGFVSGSDIGRKLGY